MRNRGLHDQLRAFAGKAADRLTAALESGMEIPFEVAQSPGQTSVLYRYRPLSDQFVRERFAELRRVDSYDESVAALAKVDGLSAYLRVLGASYVPTSDRDRAEAVLREFLARTWEDVSLFELDERRFERAYAELESVVYENTVVTTVLAPLLGVHIAAERWDLGSGLEIVRGDLCDAPPEAVWAAGREERDPNTLAVMTVEATPKDPPPLPAARLAFRKLLTALRLFKAGPASLGTSAWWRMDDGPWQLLALGHAGRTRAGDYWLEPPERDELADLFELVRVRPLSGSMAWALARFEMGCEQPLPIEGLSDHLLAARALLDDDDPAPVGLAERLAALCAEPADRAQLEQRLGHSFSLERLAMRGSLDARSLRMAGGGQPDAVALDLEQQLRALLRDMVCGYLGPDVRRVADDLLMAESASRPELRDERPERRRPRTEPTVESWDEVLDHEEVDVETTTKLDSAAEETVEFDVAEPEPPQKPVRKRPARASKAPARAPARRKAANGTKRAKPKPAKATEPEPTDEEAIVVGAFDWHMSDDPLDWGFDDPDDFAAGV